MRTYCWVCNYALDIFGKCKCYWDKQPTFCTDKCMYIDDNHVLQITEIIDFSEYTYTNATVPVQGMYESK